MTMKILLQSIRLFAVLMFLTGGLYPLLVWMAGQAFFHREAEGTLVLRNGLIIGSGLLAQKTSDPRYFHPRPSAADFASVPSGASNLAWSSARLESIIAERRAACPAGSEVPADLLTSSGSGLDPELSPEAVLLQLARVAGARQLDAKQRGILEKLVAGHVVGGKLTPKRINVLALNLALDIQFPSL